MARAWLLLAVRVAEHARARRVANDGDLAEGIERERELVDRRGVVELDLALVADRDGDRPALQIPVGVGHEHAVGTIRHLAHLVADIPLAIEVHAHAAGPGPADRATVHQRNGVVDRLAATAERRRGGGAARRGGRRGAGAAVEAGGGAGRAGGRARRPAGVLTRAVVAQAIGEPRPSEEEIDLGAHVEGEIQGLLSGLRPGAVFDLALAQRAHGDDAAVDPLNDDGIGSRRRIGDLDADVMYVPYLDAVAALRLAREPTTVEEEDVVLEDRVGRCGPIRS